ncbi:MAG: HNH endonuclease [Brevundimonas sp.]|uniref:HNH endonuclease n=1 Tax=Brevundimonas sp. TaxID=1871086 RepID=UPI001A1EDA9C|nr:HNH endonuclease [Brevundimonas sp.]MBJ7320341.1 HNH endonuclease [Brevundimonas sp.]
MAARKRSGPPIHAEIKRRLGYSEDALDREVYEDWSERKSRVCKPCWELKYCPYGPLVEQSPILPSTYGESEKQIEYFKNCLSEGTVGSAVPLSPERRADIEQWILDEDVILSQAAYRIEQKQRLEYASALESNQDQIQAFIGSGGLPPIHEYRVQFDYQPQEICEENFPPDIWTLILDEADILLQEHKATLKSGIDDNRKPLEPARRAWFQNVVDTFSHDNHPDQIPETFQEGSCNIFGHICPVFFSAENTTETSDSRRIGRGRLPFSTMMRIVRRDDYRCQHCMKKLRDDEVEFDHIIPVSKGGSSEEHKMRLTCYDCNHDKGDDYIP